MKAYELLYFVDPASDEATRAAIMKRIEVAIEGGTVDNVGAGASWPMTSTSSTRATTPSSTSMQIPHRSQSSTESCASTTP